MTGLGEDVYTDRSTALDAPTEESQRMGGYSDAPDAESLKAEGMLIEMAIRAMWAVPGKCQFSYDHARAALESLGIPLSVLAAIRAGEWVAVPREPNGEMLDAFHAAIRLWLDEEGEDADVYGAMLSAVPKTPEAAR